MKRLCRCGCGQEVIWNKWERRWNKYINHHNDQSVRVATEKSKEPPLCGCGCGEKVTWNKWKSRWNETINHHHRRGAKATKETRAKMSVSFTGRVHSEETKKRTSKALLGKKKSPEHCKNISLGQKGKVNSEECRRKISAANKGNKHSEEAKIKMAISHMKERGDGYCDAWGDQDYKNDCRKDKCEVCGKDLEILPTKNKERRYSTLGLHHIDEDKKNCHPDNLQTLCCSCHAKSHWESRKQAINH